MIQREIGDRKAWQSALYCRDELIAESGEGGYGRGPVVGVRHICEGLGHDVNSKSWRFMSSVRPLIITVFPSAVNFFFSLSHADALTRPILCGEKKKTRWWGGRFVFPAFANVLTQREHKQKGERAQYRCLVGVNDAARFVTMQCSARKLYCNNNKETVVSTTEERAALDVSAIVVSGYCAVCLLLLPLLSRVTYIYEGAFFSFFFAFEANSHAVNLQDCNTGIASKIIRRRALTLDPPVYNSSHMKPCAYRIGSEKTSAQNLWRDAALHRLSRARRFCSTARVLFSCFLGTGMGEPNNKVFYLKCFTSPVTACG